MNDRSRSFGFGTFAKFSTLLIALSSLVLTASGQTAFYVDSNRSANGDGSMGNPWSSWTSISWTSVSNALSNGNVQIYFSTVCSLASTAGFSPKANGLSASQMIQFVGDADYNTNATGTAVWYPETNGNRVIFTGAMN